MIVTLDLTPTEADLLWKLYVVRGPEPVGCLGVKLRGRPWTRERRTACCRGIALGSTSAWTRRAMPVQSVSGTGPEIADVLGIDLGAESRRIDPEELELGTFTIALAQED